MYFTEHLQQHFDAAAPVYEANAGLQASVLAICIEQAKNHIDIDGLILDAGCGTGWAALLAPSWNWLGVDIAPNMCAQALCTHGMPTVCASLDALPLQDQSVDGVISSLALQWMNEPMAALIELQRVTRPGGYAVVSTLGPATLGELRSAFFEVEQDANVSEFYSLPQWQYLAQEAGWHVASISQEERQLFYPDVMALMRNLKAIGANNKRLDRKKGLSSPRIFAQMQHAYRSRFATPQGIPATWEIIYLTLVA